MKQDVVKTYHIGNNKFLLWREEIEENDWGTPGDYWYRLQCVGHDEESGEFGLLRDARAALKNPAEWCRYCGRGEPICEENFEAK